MFTVNNVVNDVVEAVRGNGKTDRIVELLDKYNDAVEWLEELLDDPDIVQAQSSVAGLKAQITETVKKHGSSVKGESRHAVYSGPGTRVTWDNKALMGYAANIKDKEARELFLEMKTVSPTKDKVTIRKVK